MSLPRLVQTLPAHQEIFFKRGALHSVHPDLNVLIHVMLACYHCTNGQCGRIVFVSIVFQIIVFNYDV